MNFITHVMSRKDLCPLDETTSEETREENRLSHSRPDRETRRIPNTSVGLLNENHSGRKQKNTPTNKQRRAFWGRFDGTRLTISSLNVSIPGQTGSAPAVQPRDEDTLCSGLQAEHLINQSPWLCCSDNYTMLLSVLHAAMCSALGGQPEDN